MPVDWVEDRKALCLRERLATTSTTILDEWLTLPFKGLRGGLRRQKSIVVVKGIR